MTLAEYLADSKLTHEELARAVGSNVSSVTRWASGDRVPVAYFAARLEEATKGAVPVSSWPLPRGQESRRNVSRGKTGKRVRDIRAGAFGRRRRARAAP